MALYNIIKVTFTEIRLNWGKERVIKDHTQKFKKENRIGRVSIYERFE